MSFDPNKIMLVRISHFDDDDDNSDDDNDDDDKKLKQRGGRTNRNNLKTLYLKNKSKYQQLANHLP